MTDSLIDRISELERSVRRLTAGLMIVLLVGLAFVTMAFMPGKEKVIEAQRFIVKDNDGNVRAILGDWYELPAPKPSSDKYSQLALTSIDIKGTRVGLHIFATDGSYLAGLRTSGLAEYSNGTIGDSGRLSLLDMTTDSRIDMAVGNSYTDIELKSTKVTRKQAEREDDEFSKIWNAAKSDRDFDRAHGAKTPPARETRLFMTDDRSLFTMSEKGLVRVAIGQSVLMGHADIKQHRPLSSLVLFDGKGEVIRSIP